jgi:hypothetical protein
MGWRFRHSFKIIPGLRLNLSKTGISASVGGAPVTLNIGPRGLMGTASIPGAGISYRQHLNLGTPSPGNRDPGAYPGIDPVLVSPSPFVVPAVLSESGLAIEEVRSASTELLTSASLKDLKSLLQMTFQEREEISRDLGSARAEHQRSSARYEFWENGFLLKRLFKAAFAKRKAVFETAVAKVSELVEQLRLTTVAAHIEIEKEQADPYFRMRDEFARLCECAAIWDIKSHQGVDQFHERTTAIMKVARNRVRFSLDSCDLIQWEQKVPHLADAKGGDIFLYPGFILYRAAREAFSVIDYHDVRGDAKTIPFQEQDAVPADSKVIGQTWAKANKDGSRDRRFTNNYQIPIAQYGYAILRSGGGLWEEFQFSSPERLVPFLNSMNAFVASFARMPATQAGVQ